MSEHFQHTGWSDHTNRMTLNYMECLVSITVHVRTFLRQSTSANYRVFLGPYEDKC